MTSPSRRKRLITVRNTPPETTPRRRAGTIAAIVLAGLVAAAWLDSVSAADRSKDPSAVYSVGKSGSSLKWVPQRQAADKAVKAVQYQVPADSPFATPKTPVKTPSNTPFGDPFGDKKKKSTAPAPAEKINDDASLKPSTETKVPEEPKLSDEPKVLDDPKYAPEPIAPGEPAPLKETPAAESKKTESVLSEMDREKSLEPRKADLRDECPSPKDAKHIKELTTNILPPEGELPHDCPLGNEVFQKRQFSPITYTWTASGLCHKPLYFEDVQLERYGHMAGPWLQPIASGAHFFATIPLLPYKMGLEPPNECIYSLGYYRPGNCAPYMFDPIPLSARGALFEGGAWVGGFFLFP
jgi:hypothetical protein